MNKSEEQRLIDIDNRSKAEWWRKREEALFRLLPLLLLPSLAWAQGGVRPGDILMVDSQGHPRAGVTVTFCTSAGVGAPCAPLASIFQDAGLTIPARNPMTTDGHGNLPTIYAAPGVYKYTVTGTGITPSGPFAARVAGTGGGNAVTMGQQTFTGPQAFTGGFTTNSFGGDIVLDGVTYANVQEAVNACGGNPCVIQVPAGTWAPAAANTALVINQNNLHIFCHGFEDTTISYTGTTPITAVVDIGTSTTGSPSYSNLSITGCKISGNANVQYAIRTRSVHRSDFSHNSLINVTQAGIQTNYAVADTFDDLHTSSQEQAFSPTPASCIIFDGPDNGHRTTATVAKNPICEGVSGTGIVLGHTATVSILGGTSETNNKGITLSMNSLASTIQGLDTEFNTVSNVEDGGFQNHFINMTGGDPPNLYHVLGTAQESTWTGRFYDTIIIDTGALNTALNHVGYNESATGSLTDNGTFTSYLNVVNIGTGSSPYIANRFPAALTAGGPEATLSGTGPCATLASENAGSWSGSVTCTGTTGAATLVITPGITAFHFWNCSGSDITSGHELVGAQSGQSNATCTLKFSSVTANDILSFTVNAF